MNISILENLLRQKPKEAADQLHHAAFQNNAEAQTAFGELLLDGHGLDADPRQAKYWFERAANAEDCMAMNLLGRCHELGLGTDVDLTLAGVWYRQAADHGSDWGMYNYAHLLAHGLGVSLDRAQALHWYHRAALMGHARAMNFMGRYYEAGWEVKKDAAAASMWYRRAARGGDFRGQCNYASVLVERGCIDQACGWLRRAMHTATRAYLRCLEGAVLASPYPELHQVGEEIRAKLERDPADRTQTATPENAGGRTFQPAQSSIPGYRA